MFGIEQWKYVMFIVEFIAEDCGRASRAVYKSTSDRSYDNPMGAYDLPTHSSNWTGCRLTLYIK